MLNAVVRYSQCTLCRVIDLIPATSKLKRGLGREGPDCNK